MEADRALSGLCQEIWRGVSDLECHRASPFDASSVSEGDISSYQQTPASTARQAYRTATYAARPVRLETVARLRADWPCPLASTREKCGSACVAGWRLGNRPEARDRHSCRDVTTGRRGTVP